MSNLLSLNDAQSKSCNNIRKFLENKEETNFLLLGPAGSGKTTVIVNAFNNSKLSIAFCAFTNKATQVLKNISKKFDINFKSDFKTIHKLLCLEPKYLDNEHEVSFKYDRNKVVGLSEYDVIIFDECSTISQELYKFLVETHEYVEFKADKRIKYIFLGDFWQLPPVGEEKSVIFETAIADKWKVSKLSQVMRSANDELRTINETMLSWIPRFKSRDIDSFIRNYPYNLVKKAKLRYLSLDKFLDTYIDTWHNITPDTVILTYSRASCLKTNMSIQDRLDLDNNREIPSVRDKMFFYAGDRCCIDKPIEVFTIREKQTKLSFDINKFIEEQNIRDVCKIEEVNDNILQYPGGLSIELIPDEEPISNTEPEENEQEKQENEVEKQDNKQEKRTVYLERSTEHVLYNGEIFDVLEAESVLVVTSLNKFTYMPKTFEGQVLTIQRIGTEDVYKVIHIDNDIIIDARAKIKAKERRMFYLSIMTDFIKRYPKLDYGYCMTVYKSQGSEYNTVFVNLNSIKWSIVGTGSDVDSKKKTNLFKTTYTALSRASDKLYCQWFS
jgi:hypothetical protein